MGAFLLIPFFLVRFGLLSLLNRAAIRRAAYFAPMIGGEMIAYWVYQASTIAILVSLFFLRVKISPTWLFGTGIAVFLAGNILLILSVVYFAFPSKNGMNQNGVYRYSRNPMYVAYFLYFMGCAIVTQSLVLCGFICIFQLSAHWLILAEERWCIKNFGEAYQQYKKSVRRYL